MTVSVDHRRKTFQGNGSDSDFDVDFPIFDEEHIRAWDHDDTADTTTELTLNTHFTITLATAIPSLFNIDVSLLYPSGLPADHRLTVAREQAVTQETQITRGDKLPYDTIEKALDRSAMVAQDTKDRVDRVLHAPDSDPDTVDLEIGAAAARANKYQGYDADGNAALKDAPAGTTSVSALGADLIGRATADLMRNDLKIESDTFANRPVTRVNGDIFIATDTQDMYIWDSGWKLVGDPLLAPAHNFVRNPEFNAGNREFLYDSDATLIWADKSDEDWVADAWIALHDGTNIGFCCYTEQGAGPAPGSALSMKRNTGGIGKKCGFISWLTSEDTARLQTKSVSLSFQHRLSLDTDGKRLRAAIVEWRGTADRITKDIVQTWGAEGANPTLIANAYFVDVSSQLALTHSGWTKYTPCENITIPNTAKNIGIFIWTDDGTSASESDDYYNIGEVQLEIGAVATLFHHQKRSAHHYDALGFYQKWDNMRFEGVSQGAAEVFYTSLPMQRMYESSNRGAVSIAVVGTPTTNNVTSETIDLSGTGTTSVVINFVLTAAGAWSWIGDFEVENELFV